MKLRFTRVSHDRSRNTVETVVDMPPDQTWGGILGYTIARVAELEAAIKKHRAQTGNNLCWENDMELWSALKDGQTTYPHETLPCKEEFLHNCKAYYESRLVNIRTPNVDKT